MFRPLRLAALPADRGFIILFDRLEILSGQPRLAHPVNDHAVSFYFLHFQVVVAFLHVLLLAIKILHQAFKLGNVFGLIHN